jgi:hypothetical protein
LFNFQHWIDPGKRVSSQIRGIVPVTLYLGVKFYAADPSRLVEEITRFGFWVLIRNFNEIGSKLSWFNRMLYNIFSGICNFVSLPVLYLPYYRWQCRTILKFWVSPGLEYFNCLINRDAYTSNVFSSVSVSSVYWTQKDELKMTKFYIVLKTIQMLQFRSDQ